jgi:hypothetical protein
MTDVPAATAKMLRILQRTKKYDASKTELRGF